MVFEEILSLALQKFCKRFYITEWGFQDMTY